LNQIIDDNEAEIHFTDTENNDHVVMSAKGQSVSPATKGGPAEAVNQSKSAKATATEKGESRKNVTNFQHLEDQLLGVSTSFIL